MEENLNWATELCENKVSFQNPKTKKFYCKEWNIYFAGVSNCIKIGDWKLIRITLNAVKDLTTKIKGYIDTFNLSIEWSELVDELKVAMDTCSKLDESYNNALDK